MKRFFGMIMVLSMVLACITGVNALAACNHCRVCDTDYCMMCYETYTGSNIYHINPRWETDSTYHWGYCPDCNRTLGKEQHKRYCFTEDKYCFTCYQPYSGGNILHSNLRKANGESYCSDCGYYKKEEITSGNGSVGNGGVSNGSVGNGGYSNTASASQFETVRFGSFEQDNNLYNGQEPIEWYVLYSDSEKALLLSRYALINKQFNSTWTNTGWETCTLYRWLMNDFYYSAFTGQERSEILISENAYYTDSSEYGEIATSDCVFLLSLDEIYYYMGSPVSRLVQPTRYAKACGVQVKDGYSWWWLRTMGDSNKVAQFIFENGNISTVGRDVSSYVGGVRPAVWVDVSVIR